MLTYAGLPLPLCAGYGINVEHRLEDYLNDDLQSVEQIRVEDASVPSDGLEKWLKANFDLADLRSLLGPMYWPGPRQAHLDSHQWCEPPEFRLNTLYWPTGATRHAWFHCFIDDGWLEQLTGGAGAPRPLVMSSGSGASITAQMFMLPPKPVLIAGQNKLYLLSLVDQRFFWRDMNTGRIEVKVGFSQSDTTTWAQLISSLSDTMALPINHSAISAAFGFPHHSLTSENDNAAVLLENIAASLGRKVVVGLDGTVSLLTVDESQSIFYANSQLQPNADAGGLRAGGNALGINPQFRGTVLPKYCVVGFTAKGCNSKLGEEYALPFAATEFYEGADTNDSEHTLHTTACAYFNEAGDLQNDQQLTDLGTELARSFFGHQASQDAEWSGIIPLKPEGITNSCLWEYSSRDIKTRIVAAPFVIHSPDNLKHSFGFDPPFESFWAKITGVLPPAQGSTAARYQFKELVNQPGGLLIFPPNGLEAKTDCSSGCCVAYEVNGGSDDLTNQIVRMWRADPRGEYKFDKKSASSMRIVSVFDSPGTPDGTAVGPAAGCLWSGYIVGLSTGLQDFCADPWSNSPTIDGQQVTPVPVWLTVIDKPGGSGTPGVQLKTGDRYLGLFLEQYDIGGDSRPLYAIERHVGGGSSGIHYSLYTELTTSDSSQANCPVINWWGRDPGMAFVTVNNLPSKTGGRFDFYGPTGAHGIAVWDDQAEIYRIVHQEHIALFIEFRLDANLAGGSASATVASFWDGADPGATVLVHDSAGLFSTALTDAAGLARWDSEARQYEVIECESMAGWVRFTLYEDLSGGTAQATVTDFGGTQQDIQDPSDDNGRVTVKDPDGLFKRAKTGADGIAILDAVTRDYIVVECQSKAGEIAVTLASDMSGGSATASLASSAGQAGSFGTQQDTQAPQGTITVNDPFGPSGPFSIARSGAQAIAIYDNANDKYWLIECERLAIMFSATLAADLRSSSSTASISGLTAISQWPFTQKPASTPSVGNSNAHAGKSGDRVLIYRDGTSYEIFDVKKHVQTVITAHRYDTSSHKLQYKTRDLVVEVNGDETDWIDEVTFQQITYTASVDWTDPYLEYTTMTAYVLSPAADTSHVIDTPGSC